MRAKSVLMFMSILLLMNLFGCTEKPTNSEASVNENRETEDYTNSGVILDTVVDVFKEASTQSERVTQALFNQPAEILEENENWIKVKVEDGCTGWIKTRYIDKDTSSLQGNNCDYRVVVTIKGSKVLSEAKYGAVLKDVVMGTEFYPINSVDGWYEVALPGNKTGWINETGTIQISTNKNISKTSADSFVETALKFKGAVYLTGGVSAWGGIDSSGLTYISSKINGINLPRNLDQQYRFGKEIDKNLKLLIPGDLVFFSTNEDLKDISQVGIFVGEDQILNVSKSKGSVIVSSVNDNYYQKRFIGIRRIF